MKIQIFRLYRMAHISGGDNLIPFVQGLCPSCLPQYNLITILSLNLFRGGKQQCNKRACAHNSDNNKVSFKRHASARVSLVVKAKNNGSAYPIVISKRDRQEREFITDDRGCISHEDPEAKHSAATFRLRICYKMCKESRKNTGCLSPYR